MELTLRTPRGLVGLFVSGLIRPFPRVPLLRDERVGGWEGSGWGGLLVLRSGGCCGLKGGLLIDWCRVGSAQKVLVLLNKMQVFLNYVCEFVILHMK